MESVSSLIDQYGYLAVLIGTLLEGETVLMLAGFAAQRGYLDLYVVMAIAFVGGFLGDQILFFIGRRYGSRIVARYPAVTERIAAVDALLARYHAPLIFSIRFMYGLRIVGPMAFGMGRVSAPKFFIFNMLGAAVWAVLIAGAGYLFGQTLEIILEDIKQYELLAVGLIVAGGLATWLVYRLKRLRRG